MQKGLFTLPDCAKGFESVFTKEDFDIVPEHRQWDHAIKLVPGSEPQSSKVYLITNGHLLFVMGALILQRAQKCEVRQVTKDVVKSEV